jgi:DNA-directed RNA polymerase specialized sigma24 family protein
MKELTPSQQEVFRQRFIEDIPEAEIARMTGRTLHAIQMAVERVRNQMRRILERRGDDYSSLRGLLPRDAEPEFFLPNDDED